MHVLFVHQNFPAQFRYIVPRLVTDFGWRCTFVTERDNDRPKGDLPGVEKIIYEARGGATLATHTCVRNFENAVAQAHSVYATLRERKDLKPDLIVAHTGFGSSIFLPLLYDAPIINFMEYFYRAVGQDLGFRPELPLTELQVLRSQTKNAMVLLDLANCDRAWTPTHYQREFFPQEFRSKIDVIFDGIDTNVYYRIANPNPLIGEGVEIPRDKRIVTYVARGFEMMRGFDIFMRAAKRIYEQYPDVVFVVVGTKRVSYGGDLNYVREKTFFDHVLNQDDYDESKFIFTGYVQQDVLANILSLSDLHIYLTEPFIASWSMVDAMACGAAVLASDQKCVREYITHGENGLLTEFFDYEKLAKMAVEVLRDPAAYRHLGEAAARTVEEKYSLEVAIPRLGKLFEEVAKTPRSPTIRYEAICRKGTLYKTLQEDPDEEVTAVINEPAGTGAAKAEVLPAKPPEPATPPPDVTSLPPHKQAIALLRHAESRAGDISHWMHIAYTFKGAAGFAAIGEKHHPGDIRRLLARAGGWKPGLLFILGEFSGSMTYLLSRVAVPKARIIVAATPGTSLGSERSDFLRSLNRNGQSIEVIDGTADWEAMEREVRKLIGMKLFDVVYMTGLRPPSDVYANFHTFRRYLRREGLFAWDGIQPMALSPETEGGEKLWKEMKPMFPQRAEYLSGTTGMSGGFAVIKKP
jgi:glycosyltransferase involved in cell wall biosynthesis